VSAAGDVNKPVLVAARDIVDPAKCGFLNKKTSKSAYVYAHISTVLLCSFVSPACGAVLENTTSSAA